jgi:hypothetical protein
VASGTVRVEGLSKLSRAIADSEDDIEMFLRSGLLEIGEHVAVDVRAEYGRFSAKGAAGVKAKVLKRGNVLVAQTLSKSRVQSRRRRNFGGLMMKDAFLPAVAANEEYALAAGESLLRELEARW